MLMQQLAWFNRIPVAGVLAAALVVLVALPSAEAQAIRLPGRISKGRPGVAVVPPTEQQAEESTEEVGEFPVFLRPFEARAVELTLADKSLLRVRLADETIDIATKHGNLQIPADEVLGIDFALRQSPEVLALLAEKLEQLKTGDERVQKAVGGELVAMREEAYLAVKKAAESGDPLLSPPAQTVLERLRRAVDKGTLAAMREDDFVITAETKIAGKLTQPTLKIETQQFGPLDLKLADARTLRHQALRPLGQSQPDIVAAADPGTLTAFESQIGKVFDFTVTGTAAGGSVWGTDVYTTDSRLAIAAVHAGVIKVGETGVVRLKMIPSPPSFAGSTKNGITTSNFGVYRAAYQILKGEEE
jgi:hypothetical protein